jgi:3-oxoacyl-[acyl-carrier-protein] synthase-3
MGCSGYLHGLMLAHSLIASGASSKLLLLAGDTPSLHTDQRNRLVAPLFGDAGTATLLGRTDEERPAYFSLGSDGSGWQHIVIPAGGFRLPPNAAVLQREYFDGQGNPWKMTQSILEGMAVFDFTLHEAPPNIRQALALSGLAIADIDFFAIHQANKQIVEAIGRELALPPEKAPWQTFFRYGNQSTASVPCVLCDALADDMPGKNLRVLLSAFGVGFSWASAVLTFKKMYNGGIKFFDKADEIPERDDVINHWKAKFVKDSPLS